MYFFLTILIIYVLCSYFKKLLASFVETANLNLYLSDDQPIGISPLIDLDDNNSDNDNSDNDNSDNDNSDNDSEDETKTNDDLVSSSESLNTKLLYKLEHLKTA